MKLLAYISDICEEYAHNSTILDDIFQVSRINNPVNRIDGVLFYTGSQFIQVIEGPEAEIYQLMERVKADPRHKNVKIILDEGIGERSLSEWNMQPLDLSNQKSFSSTQLSKALSLVSASVELNADSFAFMVKELLEEPEFMEILANHGPAVS